MKHLIKRSIQLLTLAVGILFSIHSVHAQYPPYQQALLNQRVGFAENATGGAAGQVYWVTSLADNGAGTLRQALESDDAARWIMFAVKGTIALSSPINVRSNKTIDGRGALITITQHGFLILGSRNIIVENLKFSQGSNPLLDAIEIGDGAGDVWVDHCMFTGWPDEAVSIKTPIATAWTDVTISWCRFGYYQGKAILIGHAPNHQFGLKMRVTLHHNFFDRVPERSPRIRLSLVHAFNNYLFQWGVRGMSSNDNGQLRADENIFEAGTDQEALVTDAIPNGGDGDGYSDTGNNWKINSADTQETCPDCVFEPEWYYQYSHLREIANFNYGLKTRIQTYSGATRTLGGFANMSTRAKVQSGDGALISGMYISGTGTKKVVIRGLGPSLAPFVPGTMSNPQLTIYNSAGQPIASNNNWRESQEAEIQATGLAPSNDLEAAVSLTLAPGSYSAVLTGYLGGTGVASVEVYDIDAATTTTTKLVNISSRAAFEPNSPPIAGLILDSGLKKFIIRGIGPSLASAGIQNPILDPTLTVHDANGAVVAYNYNWGDSQYNEILETGFAPSNGNESAILINLGSGVYTVVLGNSPNTAGIGLIEVYKL